jgi:hypothetical protein
MSAEQAISPSGQGAWSRWRRPLLILAGMAALWTVLVGMWLPGWLRPRIEQAAAQALGTPVSLKALQISPWRGEVVLNGLAVGPVAAPILRIEQAQAQLSLESVWRLAPVLRRVRIDKPELWIERQSVDRFNFSAVLDKLTAPSPKPASDSDTDAVRFAVFNIELHDGLIRYDDRVLNQAHRVDQLHIGVPFVSNLPSYVNVDVKPQLSARVDGSALSIVGDALPFTEGMRSAVHVKWDAVDVPHWIKVAQPFVPKPWQLEASDGRLDADLTLKFEARKPPAVPKLTVEGGFTLSKLALRWPHAPMLGQVEAGWQSLEIRGLDAQPLERQLKVGAVLLDGVQWRNRPLASQAIGKTPPMLSAKAPASAASKSTTGSSPAAAPWAWQIGQLQLNVARLDVQTEAMQAWPVIDLLRVKVDGLSSDAKAAPARWQLNVHDEHDASLLAQGHVQAARQIVDAQIKLSKAQISPWLAPLAPSLQLPFRVEQGQLGVQAQLDARLKAASALEPAQIRLMAGHVAINQLRAPAAQRGSSDHLALDELSLDGIQVQLDLTQGAALRGVSADKLSFSKLDVAITRGPKGELLGVLPKAARATDKLAGKPVATGREPRRDLAPALPFSLKALHCSACQFAFRDQSVGPYAAFELHQTDLHVADLSQDLSRPISLELDTLAQGKGRVRIKGTVKPQPLQVDARINMAGLDLRAIQPYIDPMVNIRLAGAKAHMDGQVKLDMPLNSGMQLRYRGRAGLSDVRVLDRVNDADLLSWQALTLDGADVAVRGDDVDANLGRIALKDFYGRIIINPNGQLNVAGIMRHEAGAQARSLTTPEAPALAVASAVVPPSAPASAAALATRSKAAPTLRWQQIQLSKGRVDFTDNFIKPNYSARLTQVEGDVSAVSSSRPEPAKVKISGAVDDAAPLLVTGQLHPLGPKLYTDIEASAKGIELTRLTPYAARYAGYAIDKGALSINVHYKVDGGKLEASNHVFLDQLTFGEKTDSPDATKLPVLFAVSLLKNSKGEIDINLPISGSLDDPQFSVGSIIWRVLANLITKAVTAPFALLSGGGTEELGYVAFDAGQSELSGSARQSLDTLATKLLDRPALKLAATGRADADVDLEGLRQAHVEGLMRAAKAKATGGGAADMQLTAAERGTWLAAAYKAADIKKPRNPIGIAKALPDADMMALLKAAAPVNNESLLTLANQRGDQVKAYLAHKLPLERVLLTASRVGKGGLPEDKGPASRVQFDIK